MVHNLFLLPNQISKNFFRALKQLIVRYMCLHLRPTQPPSRHPWRGYRIRLYQFHFKDLVPIQSLYQCHFVCSKHKEMIPRHQWIAWGKLQNCQLKLDGKVKCYSHHTQTNGLSSFIDVSIDFDEFTTLSRDDSVNRVFIECYKERRFLEGSGGNNLVSETDLELACF